MKKDKEDNPKEYKKKELTSADIQDLPLIDNDFFLFASNGNKELAEVLIKPALDYLGIKNYSIESVTSEVFYSNLKNHSVRIDCEIKLENNKVILIEVQNSHPEEMPLKRIRFETSSFNTKNLDQGEPYENLPDIISLVYTTKPLLNHDTGDTVNDLAMVDLRNGKIAEDYGHRILIVNGKYKNEEFKSFSDVIEDLQKQYAEDVKNPVIKDIHIKTKETEKGRSMLSEYIEENYGKKIREYEEQLKQEKEKNKKAEEENKRFLEQHLKDQEEKQKLKMLLEENGIVFD